MIPIIRPINSKITKCLLKKNVFIFFDLESYGKQKRQKNHYQYKVNTIDEIEIYIKKYSTKNLLVRVDNPNSPFFKDQLIFLKKKNVANIMIPYFKNIKDLKDLKKLNLTPKNLIFLFETIQSVNKIEKFIKIYNISKCYIGLNDLSISLGYGNPYETAKLFFSPLITKKAKFLKRKKIKFGVGGISYFNDTNLLFSPKVIKKRFNELGSQHVLMSSNFYKKISEIKSQKKIDNFLDKYIQFLKN